MSQEIEIEYKALLTFTQFNHIAKELPFPTDGVEQINYYFETKSFQLKEHKSALRIRKKNDSYTLTLKEPYKDNILETHDSLTEEEFYSWINAEPIAKPNVTNQLTALQIEVSDLVYFGSLKTVRKSFTKDNIEYVLDKSTYNGVVDYELEIEARTNEAGFAAFEQVLQQFNIDKQISVTKIERFFQTSNR